MERWISLLGMLVLLGIAFLLSSHKKNIPWRLIIIGLLLQFVFGILFLPNSFLNDWIVAETRLTVAPGAYPFEYLKDGVVKLIDLSREGLDLLFTPFALPTLKEEWQNIIPLIYQNLIFYSLPTIIFFSALMSLLYHLGILQRIVYWISWLMKRTLRISGAESLATAANIFVGMIEAPLIVRPYVEKMTRSELFTVMVGGMATIAGTVMGLYISFFTETSAQVAGHLLAASIMSAPAAILIAKIMIPETESPQTMGEIKVQFEKDTQNVMDAISKGAMTGITLLLNIIALLIAILGLLAILNYPLEYFFDLSLEEITGYLLFPIAWVMGIPASDALAIGQLMGTKILVNELVALKDLSQMALELDPRSTLIASYALCGFANFASVGIIIGGISAIAPSRRGEIAALGIRSLVGGALSSFLTATVAGLICWGI